MADAGKKPTWRRAAALPAESARSVLGDLLRHRRLRPVRRAQLRRGDVVWRATASGSAAISSAPTGCHGRRRHGGGQAEAAAAALRRAARGAAQCFTGLDRDQMPIRGTPTARIIWKAFPGAGLD